MADPQADTAPAFEVSLANFTGPFDVLLELINRHQMDVTEVALATVTDDFIRYLQAEQSRWDLDQASHFLVVAATLLELKTLRLLPGSQTLDEDDLEVLAARDLLFARLLQYRAYKQVAGLIDAAVTQQNQRFFRQPPIEAALTKRLPELVLDFGPQRLAQAVGEAYARGLGSAPPEVDVAHLHTATVTVAEQVGLLAEHLAQVGSCTFRDLVVDETSRLVVAVRFLAILELYREAKVLLEQDECFGDLLVLWSPDGVVAASAGAL